jgi:hypothetical protein
VARTPNDQLVIGVSMNNLLSLDPASATGNDVVEIASVLLTLLGLLFLTFVIGRVMPLDPVLSIVGPDADRSTYNQVRQQLGLDRPLVVQFGYYLRDLSHADLGKALLTGHPVRDDLARVLPPWPASGRCSRARSGSSRCRRAFSGCTRWPTSAA